MPPEVGEIVAGRLPIPVLSIGAGALCDGQLLIVSDLLGIFEAFTPKFVKKYAALADEMGRAFRDYVADVKAARFPEEKHTYRMVEGELEKLKAALK